MLSQKRHLQKPGCDHVVEIELILTSSAINKKLEIAKKLENKLEIDKNLEIKLEIYKNLENKLEIYNYFKLENKLEIFEFFVNGRWSQSLNYIKQNRLKDIRC